MARYLTKSRFKLAAECPTKLFYTGKTSTYADMTQDDPFLQALADGGFQVGELAKVMFPGGIEIQSRGHEKQVRETDEHLRNDEVTLFEAAVGHGDLFARIDVLHKKGDVIELIEVKAKSFDSTLADPFRGASGKITADWLPYLQDAAFQTLVLRKAYPAFRITPFLMLADKARPCSVDGLNQRFRIRRHEGRPVISVVPGTSISTIGTPILSRICVDELIEELLASPLATPGSIATWEESLEHWADAYRDDRRIAPEIGAHCGRCQFHDPSGDTGLRSGRAECWRAPARGRGVDISHGTVLDLWNFRRKAALIDAGTLLLSEVTKDDLKFKEGDAGLSHSERQWMQVAGRWSDSNPFYIDRQLMEREMKGWQFPLHFIDFETASVAIPYFAGHRPYEMVAFQYSHHIVDSNGRVIHQSEYLNRVPGRNPNYDFARSLRQALDECGTVFMWSHHENTMLNSILRELEEDKAPPSDAPDLRQFLQSLTTRKEKGGMGHSGVRAMVDLCRLAEKAFFHPATKGSSSIKKVLPAVLQSSPALMDLYSQPVYGAEDGIVSKNFKNMQWYRVADGHVANPYKLLPSAFSDLPLQSQQKFDLAEDLVIADGGAATTAYARLQFEELQLHQREAIEAALLKYCELDTLAMVMIYQAWAAWCVRDGDKAQLASGYGLTQS